MKILVADDTGLIRNIEVEDKKVLNTYGEQGEGMSIRHMIQMQEVWRINTNFILELDCDVTRR